MMLLMKLTSHWEYLQILVVVSFIEIAFTALCLLHVLSLSQILFVFSFSLGASLTTFLFPLNPSPSIIRVVYGYFFLALSISCITCFISLLLSFFAVHYTSSFHVCSLHCCFTHPLYFLQYSLHYFALQSVKLLIFLMLIFFHISFQFIYSQSFPISSLLLIGTGYLSFIRLQFDPISITFFS